MEETKKSSYKGFTEARKTANEKYLNTLEDIKLRVPKGSREKYKQAAQARGYSLNQFAIEAMDEKIEREPLEE